MSIHNMSEPFPKITFINQIFFNKNQAPIVQSCKYDKDQ